MGFFSSKKEEKKSGLVELPDLPDLPEFSEDKMFSDNVYEKNMNKLGVEVSPLPQLPGERKEISRDQIKKAIESAESAKMEKSKFEPLPYKFKEPEEMPSLGTKIITPTISKKSEQVYIRIDKFQTAMQLLSQITDKVNDISKVLEKTKRIKEQEEMEIQEWEREIQAIKLKLESIDKTIFNNLD